jgi:hypothetical protein
MIQKAWQNGDVAVILVFLMIVFRTAFGLLREVGAKSTSTNINTLYA